MTHDFQPWTPPPGAVVAPPVHPQSRVICMWSDGVTDDGERAAGSINWSSYGDGPCVVAYAVVEEYKPAPRAMKAVWNDCRNCFEIYVTNVDYRDGTTMTVFGDLP